MKRALLWIVGLGLCSAPVQAADGDPIRTNHYNVEYFQGPVLAPLRVTGLAGAYTAYAEGVDGIAANVTAPAVREPFSVNRIEYDISAGISFPAGFGKTDFDNDGRAGFTYNQFVFYTLGAQLQWGPLGIGALGDFQRYDLSPNAHPDDPHSTLTAGHLDVVAAWAFFEKQLMIGGGLRLVTLNIQSTRTPTLARPFLSTQSQTLLSAVGYAPEIGVLIRPDYQPWRIGLTYRAAASGSATHEGQLLTDEYGVQRVAGLAVPQTVQLPWELRAGFAIQVGPRPFNPKWINPAEQSQSAREQVLRDREARRRARESELRSIGNEQLRALRAEQFDREEKYLQREEDARLDRLEDRLLQERKARYWNWPREYILVIAEAAITGRSPNAVSLESFLSQTEHTAGAHASVTPRLGLEGEPVVGWVKTRFGTYIEPSRYLGRPSRQHFTFGFDVRLFDFGGWFILAPSTFRVSAMADLAPRYENLGVSIGAWH